MSFLVPKKPQILYAPMLSSFGGGSARGFNPGGGPLRAPDFSGATGVVHAASNAQLLRVNVSSFNGGTALVDNPDFDLGGSFPAQMLDVAWGLESPSTIRIVGQINSDLNTLPTNFANGTTPVTTTDTTYINGSRAICMCRNGYLVVVNSSSQLSTFKLNSNGTFTRVATIQDSGELQNVQSIINPDDGGTLGTSTTIFLASINGPSRFKAYQIGDDGSITYKQSATGITTNTQLVLSPMKPTSANTVKMMVFPGNAGIRVYDYNYVTNSFTLTNTGSTWSTGKGQPSTASPGWGGWTYIGSQNPGTFAKIYQNGTIQDQFENTSLNGSHLNGLLAIEDGTSSTGVNGHVYWVTYNGGSSPERRVMRTDDISSTGFTGTEQTDEIFDNGAYGVGGSVIGTRPKYAEFDAKLANW